jgi:hypothetical protein
MSAMLSDLLAIAIFAVPIKYHQVLLLCSNFAMWRAGLAYANDILHFSLKAVNSNYDIAFVKALTKEDTINMPAAMAPVSINVSVPISAV